MQPCPYCEQDRLREELEKALEYAYEWKQRAEAAEAEVVKIKDSICSVMVDGVTTGEMLEAVGMGPESAERLETALRSAQEANRAATEREAKLRAVVEAIQEWRSCKAMDLSKVYRLLDTLEGE
jgi:hypothetical protein